QPVSRLVPARHRRRTSRERPTALGLRLRSRGPRRRRPRSRRNRRLHGRALARLVRRLPPQHPRAVSGTAKEIVRLRSGPYQHGSMTLDGESGAHWLASFAVYLLGIPACRGIAKETRSLAEWSIPTWSRPSIENRVRTGSPRSPSTSSASQPVEA